MSVTISTINGASKSIQVNAGVNSPTMNTLDSGSTTPNMTLEAGKAYNIQVNNNDGTWQVAIFDA